MLLCGIHDGHNAAAAIIKEGRLLAAVQEERITRIKNWHGFPERAIETLLKSVGASWTDVDAYVFNGNEYYLPPGGKPGDRSAQIESYRRNCKARGQVVRLLRNTPIRSMVHEKRRRMRVQGLLNRGVRSDRITPMEHHACHAAAAYFGRRNPKDSLIFTIDGAGDGLCATVSIPRDDGFFERLSSIHEEHSLGIMWNVITSLMGMVPNEHEYKMMGMAPYAGGSRGEACADIFRKAFELRDGKWWRANGLPESNYTYEYWREALEFQRFDYICAGLQMATEQIVIPWIQHWVAKTGRHKLCLSGGVFMNVKMNKVICDLPEVEDVYVFPSCGDETNTIGACWSFLAERGKAETIEPMGAFYLGLEPSAATYDKAAELARQRGSIVERPADIENAVASLLASGQVVARISGREEFGARALGNRSILADPKNRDIVRVINRAIKSRDFWMPFACSIVEEAQHDYLINPKGISAPYMILTFDSKNTDDIIAGCHPEDGTVRPQIVTKDWNPTYHRIISLFRQRTGRGALLNTSFNLHGEPIASQPEEAIDVMDRSGLTNLQLGPYLVKKKG